MLEKTINSTLFLGRLGANSAIISDSYSSSASSNHFFNLIICFDWNLKLQVSAPNISLHFLALRRHVRGSDVQVLGMLGSMARRHHQMQCSPSRW